MEKLQVTLDSPKHHRAANEFSQALESLNLDGNLDLKHEDASLFTVKLPQDKEFKRTVVLAIGALVNQIASSHGVNVLIGQAVKEHEVPEVTSRFELSEKTRFLKILFIRKPFAK